MTSLRSSVHYVWNTSQMLGKGATGGVYQGMHKRTGEPVAVKTFNHCTRSRMVNNLQMHEFEVLKKLNHENIVKVLAMEEEAETQKKVLIMELCNGGSLYSILDDPQNSYGLEETEFLRVLHDLSAGMKYLRDNIMIHRDLKPGNIMKFITEDGRSVYKFIDFGAARELQENEEFLSLHGTEEYLHPDVYEKAVLKRPSQKKFRATVDLWSIGVTLYHVATGSLPFRPYGGRDNKETMDFILFKKAPGVISGVQHSEKGPIEWSQELPKTCLLNQGLRDLLTKLLVGILERDAAKIWNFDQFFDCVTDILTRRAIRIFYMNEGREISLYMKLDQTLKDVKDQIATQLKVPQNNQMLLYEKNVLESIVDPGSKISTYPHTTYYQPLVLLHNESTVVKDLTRFGALSDCFPKFDTTSVNFDHDAANARSCCSVAHAVKRLVEKLVRCRSLLLSTPKQLLNLIHDSVTKLCNNLDVLTQTMNNLEERFHRLDKSSSVIAEFLNCWPSEHQCKSEQWKMKQVIFEKKQLKDELSTQFLSLQAAVFNLKQRVLVSGMLQEEWDQSVVDCPDLNGCAEKANTYVNKMRDSWQVLVKNKNARDRNGRTLSYYDEQFHILEKVKIQNTCEKLLTLVQEQCAESCRQAFRSLDNWYSAMQATLVKCRCVDEEMTHVAKLAEKYTSAIQEAEMKADEICQEIILQLQSCKSQIKDNPAKQGKSKSLMKRSDLAKQLDELTTDISSLKEQVQTNDSLIERLIQANLGCTLTEP